MISNNTSYKLKTSKSKEFHDYDTSRTKDTFEGENGDSDLVDNLSKCGNARDSPYRGSGRRATEFRSSRNHERRGGFRGRGSYGRRGEREYFDSVHVLSRKYDSSSRNTDSGYHGKFYEPEKKTEIKLNLPEDTRISKLLRRLNFESDQDNSLIISKKLLQVLLLPDNAVYVRKAFHILGESMYEILQVSPGPLAKRQAARALGRMGYIMGQENDFERYISWLFNKVKNSSDDLIVLFMKSLKETLAFEKNKSVLLKEHVQRLIYDLANAIERTDNNDVFKSILDVLMTTVEIYPDSFHSQFRDTVDLLFGWHVDHTQPLSNIEFISTNLQRITKYFEYYFDFSMTLTENFLDDISNYTTQMKNSDETDESDSLQHVTVLIMALNTILKCLIVKLQPPSDQQMTEFMSRCIEQIIQTATYTLTIEVPQNLIIAANECIGILLSCLENKSVTLSHSIYFLLSMEMAALDKFCNASIISFLLFASKIIKELSANLKIELIEKLIGPSSELLQLRYSPFREVRESVILVYQALLNLKNVPLLQEAYRYVLGDLEIVYTRIIPEIEPVAIDNPFVNGNPYLDDEQLELTALFLLRCLSQLANASSIIVMWALKPNILELIGVTLKPSSEILAKSTPTLQYSLLYLLYSHCKCYNHFISNSDLVAKKPDTSIMGRFMLSDALSINDVPNTSPNSGNFTIILNIIHQTLTIDTSKEVTLLLLQWLYDILINSENYLEKLYDNEKFTPITEVLVKCGYNFDNKIVLSVYDNLEKLLGNKHLAWNNGFLSSVCDLCRLHMNSNHAEIRGCYSKLASYIPWDVAIVEFNRSNAVHAQKKNRNLKDYNNYMISVAQRLHLNGTVYGEMMPLHFKTLMGFLLKNEKSNNGWLEEMFTCCWTCEIDSQMNMDLFYDLATSSRNVLHSWATLEAAEFCVNNKLRTPLGKPNETFTKIESALNQLGNDLISRKKTSNPGNPSDSLRVSLLIQFIEQLEKSIYNASEGCAIAMPPPSKLVRSFFIANTNTCNEWLSRIRMVVIHIALHSGDSNVALRHGQALLKDLIGNGKGNTTEFERTTMFVTLALLNLKETEAIQGLYVWCKANVGRRFSWIKCAAEQASKRYESAIHGYQTILTSRSEVTKKRDGNGEDGDKSDSKKLDSDIQHFILDQILICYKELHDSESLSVFYKDSVVPFKSVENGRRYWFNTIDWDCFLDIFNIESELFAFNELSRWDYKGEPKSWSMYDHLSTTENNLYNLFLSLTRDTDELILDKIDFNSNLIQKSIQDQINLAPSEFVQSFSLMQYICEGLRNVANGTTASSVFLVSENFENEINKIDSTVLRQILWWSEQFGKLQNQGLSTFCSNLRLDVMKRARKEKNFDLAINHFHRFLKDKGIVIEMHNETTLWYEGSCFVQEVSTRDMWSIDIARAITEIIKLSYSKEDSKRCTFNLCAAASTEISKNYDKVYGGNELRKISAKILLKLATWMQTNEQISLTELSSPLGKFLMVLPEIGGMVEHNFNAVVPAYEMAIGKLLQFTAHQCVSLAKSWNAFGTWCYRWGKKVIDSSADVKSNFTEEDFKAIKNILPPDVSPEEISKVLSILSQTRTAIDEEDIDSNEINTSEMIKEQLQCVAVLRNANELQLQGLVQIWRNTQKRVYVYYELSAEAYFKYLHFAMNSENITRSTEYNTITVTLRLLRLIVKYALELQCILEKGLQATPTQPWKVIIPQLFSRLNHPESYVRQRVSDLLCRVAEDAPHLITFPAVVGALEGGLKFDFSEISLPKDCLSQNNENTEYNELNEDVDIYESDDDCSNALQSCFKTMVDTLSKQDPETIAQVQTLVKELRRITLLWDELWLGTLAQHQTEILKRQQQLEYEIDKVNDNTSLVKEEKISLIAEKHRIIIKPIIFVLEQLLDVTSVEAETPHEKLFQERYLEEIRDVIQKLKNPEYPEKPQQSLQPLKQLQKKFQQKFHKRASYSLKMQEISPILAGIKNTVIAMPGLSTMTKTRVTISHVSNNVSILPTKTKPKKLIFYGSDGQTYAYLFKGLEDLHLDERIMQFLSIANTMMAQNTDPSGHNFYRAKYYSVIPLGPRSGLISWVDGTTPVFSLYKRWQQREILKPNTKNAPNTNTSVLRPSELFYKKLNPLLQEHGVKNLENRKEWPLSILKQVLTELMSETPSDLLAKELWCNSVSAAAWWQVVKRYSYSVAVMSIIGYIIGLGDRHLDNMLVDLTSGEVIHIDYNVCFEKGKTLRVPEKVPFRLTPNIRDALGVTGVEGIFRLACENVLKSMRKGRETLLTLLEAFVYDPLIDWTVGSEVLAGTTFGGITTSLNAKQNRKDLEKEVTMSMFNVRCTEMRAEWMDNKEDIISECEPLLGKLTEWLGMTEKINVTEDYLQDLHQQMALVKEAEAHGINNHPLYSLPARYDSYHMTQDALRTARKDLDKLVSAADSQIRSYVDSLRLLDSTQINSWLHDLNVTVDADNIFDLVKEFLHNAGKDDVVAHCEQSELEVSKLAQLQNASAKKCLRLFQEYYNILTQCPKHFLDNHRSYLFLKWAKYLLETKTTEGCEVIFEQFRALVGIKAPANIAQFISSLENQYKEVIAQVNKTFEELSKIRNNESNGLMEKMYSTARIGISTFLASEKGAVSAFEFVIANELIILNQGLITLEKTAHRSGDWLIKLTTRDGDWFLDDLVVNTSKALELVNNLPLSQNIEEVGLYQMLTGIKLANGVYKGLQEMLFNFHTIILPESIKRFQSEDFSVMQMTLELKTIISGVGMPLNKLIIQLEKILSDVLLQNDIDPTYAVIMETVSSIRVNYQMLIQPQCDPLTPGKMLLMGFNGLFEKLNQELNHLISALNTSDVPIQWKSIDQVKEAKSISAHIFHPDARKLLDDIFFLKRLSTITEFFTLCQVLCFSYKDYGPVENITDENLIKPVKQFIADFISKQVLGITPETISYTICYILQHLGLDITEEIDKKDIGAENKFAIDDLYQKAWNVFIKQGLFTGNILSQASSLETNLKTAWEKIQEPKSLEQKLGLLQSSAVRLQNQLNVHTFMFEESISPYGIFPCVRSKFILELKTEMTTLKNVFEKLNEAHEKQKTLVESAYQRLNWAKGVNPNVLEISAAFVSSVECRNAQMAVEQKISSDILNMSGAILHHEILRSPCMMETKSYDKMFRNCYEKWSIACEFSNSKSDSLTPTEESIMNLLTPDMVTDPKWLQVVSETISEIIGTSQKKLADNKKELFLINDSIASSIEVFKTHFNVHNKLVADIKGLIKSMSKIEDYNVTTQQFIIIYRQYYEHFSSLFTRFKKEITQEEIKETDSSVKYLQENTEAIYECLLNLDKKKMNPQLTKQDCLTDPLIGGVGQSQGAGKGQQRNAYAVNVWRRVKMKLEGRDPDPTRKYTPQEQVDYVIREATNVDNLALLYEGWTPWV